MSLANRKSALIISLLFASSATNVAAQTVAPDPKTSWGQGGISFDQYRTDSVECAIEAAEIDLEGTAPAKALQYATRVSENANTAGDHALAIRFAALEIQLNRAATLMKDHLENCLVKRGYVQFRLTKSQYSKLKQYDYGSDDRRQYLFSLASDQTILDEQSVTRK